jgi:hypothetical protein
MTTRDEPWPHGTPAWVDLMVEDVAAAGSFYERLFGWRAPEGPPEAGGYRVAELRGQPVAGLGPKPAGAPFPSTWTTYLAVDDLDDAVAKVKNAGGRVLMEPMDVMEEGRFGMAADPTGAVFGLWQAKNHIGCRVVNEPGALIWNECMSADYKAAKAFYTQVFGYDLEEMGEESFNYATFRVQDDIAGGIGELDAAASGDLPSHWLTYFAVADTDEAVARATELGAEVLSEPRDSPYGRMATLQGAQGERFCVIAAPSDDSEQ